MTHQTGKTAFRKELTKDEITEHLRQVCLMRHHLVALTRPLYPLSADSEHLNAFRAALERHQARYTGNRAHFHSAHIAMRPQAND